MRLPVPIRRICYRLAYLVLSVYWFVFRPAASGVKCVLTDGERILLVRHTYGRAVWEIPGGTMRRHEPPARTARREMSEELGIDSDAWRPIGTFTGQIHRREVTLHCFALERTAPELTLDGGELAAAQWFDRTALPPRLGKYVRTVLELLPG